MSEPSNIVSFRQDSEFLQERAREYRQKDPLRALDLMHHALSLSPEQASYRIEEAELLSELGCVCESILSIARAHLSGEVPAEAYYGLACNLVAMSLIDAASDALALYLQTEPEGERAEEALQLLASMKFAEELALPDDRRKRRAFFMAKQAARLMRAQRFEPARRLLLRALAYDKKNRQLAKLLVQCDLKTGRSEQACRLVEALCPHETTEGILLICMILSEEPGHEALIEKLFAMLTQADMDVERRASKLKTYLNLGDGAWIHRLLPGLLYEQPYDLGLLHASAVEAARGGDGEKAERCWQRMLRVRPQDGLAAQYLSQPPMPGESLPWLQKLSEERTQALLARCEQPGEALLSLAQWALSALNEQALQTLCPRLAMCEDIEAEGLLREVLAHPQLSATVKQYALEALSGRGARPPYLYVTGTRAALLNDGLSRRQSDGPSNGLKRLLARVEEEIELLLPEGEETLLRLWTMLATSPKAAKLRHAERLAAALMALTMEKRGEPVDFAQLSHTFEQSERLIYHHMEQLRPILEQ